jgi:iron complex outermembrane receptor protein
LSDGLHHSTGIIELGDLALEQSSSQTIHNGAEKWTNFSVEVNPFYKQYW